jgi:hypothetical protein
VPGGDAFSPLDKKLKLRADHWSEGAARVATRQGLQIQSFDLAAEAYTDAVGGAMSRDSLRRITEGWGQQVEQQRQETAARANAPAQVANTRAALADRPSRRAEDPLVLLKRHSYQAGLWEADTMVLCQYSEGLRRGLDHCQRLSSVNDGAPWIERITDLNFPNAVQIVDWTHASERLWKGNKAVLGEQTAQGKQ